MNTPLLAALLSPKGIVVLCAVLSWILAVMVEVKSMRHRGRRSLPDFVTVALLAQGLGLLLLSQRGEIPGFLSVYVSNLLTISAISLFYLGIERLHGDSGSWLVASLPTLTIAILFPLIGFSDAVLVERVVVSAIASFVAYMIVAFAALRITLETGRKRGPALIGVAMLMVIGAHVVRAMTMIEQSRGELFARAAPQTLFFLVLLVAVVLAITGYFLMIGDNRPRPGSREPASGQPDLEAQA